MKKLLIILSIVLVLAFSAFAQGARTPAQGSAERTAILNALRVPVERDLKQKIQFAIQTIKVQGNWAFVNGEPQNLSGGEPNYKNTKYWEAYKEGMFDNNFQALLKKTGGKWRVITYAIGCTDVCYADWWRRHKAPKAVFPYTE